MRITQDNITVLADTLVFEIMYKYDNPESSTPYPEQRKVCEIPETAPIYFHLSNAQAECHRRLRKAAKKPVTPIFPYSTIPKEEIG